ncbi:MAG: XRE family transcriptional regulator [Lysobacterales bacterium]|nr:MAG: XRE family transcriptional regulator [Xanthomonadales bacterium]
MNAPTPQMIRKLRGKLGLTRSEAAGIIECSARTWEAWEAGRRPMHPAFWFAFKHLTNQ